MNLGIEVSHRSRLLYLDVRRTHWQGTNVADYSRLLVFESVFAKRFSALAGL
jgi:hypothetical protein